jgi:hypothetical protein
MMMLVEYVRIITINSDEELMSHRNHFSRKKKLSLDQRIELISVGLDLSMHLNSTIKNSENISKKKNKR